MRGERAEVELLQREVLPVMSGFGARVIVDVIEVNRAAREIAVDAIVAVRRRVGEVRLACRTARAIGAPQRVFPAA